MTDQPSAIKPRLPDHNARALATIMLHTRMLQGYNPGKRLREFIAPQNSSALDAIDFEGNYLQHIPARIADSIDDVIIDWVTKRASNDSAGARLDDIARELQELAVDKPESENMIAMCQRSIEMLRTKILPYESERLASLRMIESLRKTLSAATDAHKR